MIPRLVSLDAWLADVLARCRAGEPVKPPGFPCRFPWRPVAGGGVVIDRCPECGRVLEAWRSCPLVTPPDSDRGAAGSPQ